MNAQQAIDAFDAACEQDTAQRLANAEAQRYGEAPVVLPEKPKNPWDQPVGSGDAIQQWRDAFVCLRVVGKNVWGDLPAPPSAARDDFAAFAAASRSFARRAFAGWVRGAVTAPGRSVNDPIDFPAVDGVVREEDGNLYLTVTERQGNQFLAEAGLLPEQGLWSVKAVQRVLKLAGMSNNGDDDRILVNMQRPLP